MSTSTEQHSVSLAPRLVGIVAVVLTLVIGTSFIQSRRADEVYAQVSHATAETFRATQLALTAQVRFKKQVQEFKNILLRGGSDADLAKYRGQFFEESKKAQTAVLELLSLLPEDSDARRAAAAFAKAHQRLQGQYEEGLALFLEDRASPFRVDAYVRGIDRKPTDLLDEVVAGVAAWRQRSLDRAATQFGEARRTAYAVQAFVCLMAVVFLFWALRSWVYRPLQAGIELAERVSNGDLDSSWKGRAAPGEVGRLLQALDRMRASLRTMEDRKAKQHRQLEEARNSAQAGERAKSQFLSNVSHELRTPLNGILGNLSFLDDAVAERGVDHLRQAHNSAQDLLTLVDRILVQTQRDSDQQELRIDVFEPRQMISRMECEQGAYAHGRGLKFSVDVDSAVPEALIGDSDKLRQVVDHLVENAIKFTDHGFVAVRVLPASQFAEGLRVEVHDSGIGVPEGHQARIFHQFTQVDDSNTRRHGGLGLGLAHCQQLVQLMRGWIALCATSAHQGSVFCFEVPMAIGGTRTRLRP